jgi:hypothetical protein
MMGPAGAIGGRRRAHFQERRRKVATRGTYLMAGQASELETAAPAGPDLGARR